MKSRKDKKYKFLRNKFPNRDLSLRVLVGVKRVYPPDPPARLRRIRQGTRRLLSRARPGRLFCSGKQSFLKRGNPKKKPSFSLQTYAPSRKFRSLFRKKKSIVFTADVCSVGKKRAKRAQTSYQKLKNGQKSGTDGA